MNNQPNRHFITVWLLITLQFLLGLGALFSGGLLIAAPDGAIMQMPVSMLQYSPFSNFLIPGLILFIFLGLYPLAVAYSLWQKPTWAWPEAINPFKSMHWSWAGSLASGLILVIWIIVQALMLQTVAFLHILYFVWGFALIVLTLAPGVRQQYTR